MKFVAIIDLTKKKPEERIVTFVHDEPGPLPPFIEPKITPKRKRRSRKRPVQQS
jgi:hypothetical protein